jgi:hypothetical protein
VVAAPLAALPPARRRHLGRVAAAWSIALWYTIRTTVRQWCSWHGSRCRGSCPNPVSA